MIGLGVGIDYSVFVLSRQMEFLSQGHDPVEAVGRSLSTAGHAVLVAGCTVIVALLGLLLVQIPLVSAIALTSGLAVLVMMIAALTLMPALLGALGHRVNSLHVPHLGARERAGDGPTPSERWARHVTRRAAWYLPAGICLLLLLASPLLAMRLGPQDAGSDPRGSTTREAYDLISEGFGVGANDPLFVIAEAPARRQRDHRRARGAALRGPAHGPGRRVRGPAPHRQAAAARPWPRSSPAPAPTPRPRPRWSRTCASASIPPIAGGQRPGGRGGRRGRRVGRPGQPRRRPHGPVHPLRGGHRLHPADARLPLAVPGRQGRRAQPAVDRRLLRRAGGGVPVGLGRVAWSASTRRCRSSPSSP